MPDTFGELKAQVLEWLEESLLPTSRLNAACNDAIESLWSSIVTTYVSAMVVGPVSVSLSSGTDGVILISVSDPTTAPTLGSVTSGNLDQHGVVVAYSLVTESGTETLISDTASATIAALDVCSVTSPAFVSGAVGWNIYAGSTSSRLCKQNETPWPFGTDYQEPDSGFADNPNSALPPVENTTGDDICYIRMMENAMPDGGFKKYDAADIDSLLMRRVSSSIAASSVYQNVYWDLVNQRQLEFRPKLALTITPRYFYVKRPRRIIFDNAPLPFLTIPSVAFLRSYALARLSLSIREFESAAAWEGLADKERLKAEQVVAQMSRPKNQYITPY